jgi:cytoskeletal protein CcmA (bactofilin family)
MFDRNKGRQAEAAPREPGAAAAATQERAASRVPENRSQAMIGPSIVIKGTVTGDEDLNIQGTVEGTIELRGHEVTVSQGGRVTADVIAKLVRIDGEVAGDVNGVEKVVISKSGNVRGNIVAPRVVLEDGAAFKGSIDMDPGKADTGSNSPTLAKQAVAKPLTGEVTAELDLKSG